VATRLGANVDSLEFDWGTSVIPELVKLKLLEKKYDLVAVVHAETSTGVAILFLRLEIWLKKMVRYFW